MVIPSVVVISVPITKGLPESTRRSSWMKAAGFVFLLGALVVTEHWETLFIGALGITAVYAFSTNNYPTASQRSRRRLLLRVQRFLVIFVHLLLPSHPVLNGDKLTSWQRRWPMLFGDHSLTRIPFSLHQTAITMMMIVRRLSIFPFPHWIGLSWRWWIHS